MEQEDSFLESFESLLDTIKRLVVKPVKRVTGFASLGFLLIVLIGVATERVLSLTATPIVFVPKSSPIRALFTGMFLTNTSKKGLVGIIL